MAKLLPKFNPLYVTEETTYKTVKFYHPAYPSGIRPLLCLPALDSSPAVNDTGRGIQYDVALAACGIIANNRWNGAFFTSTPEGQKLLRPADGLLRNDTYYFHLFEAKPPHRYPVVPNFNTWRFPHDVPLPEPWEDLELPDYADYSKKMIYNLESTIDLAPCRLTGSWVGVQKAHIIPQSAESWFMERLMDVYSLDESKGIHDVLNLMRLQVGVHIAFDARKFCIIPKRISADTTIPPRLAVHVVTRGNKDDDAELRTVYHNRPIFESTHFKRQFLFARFAWTILSNKHLSPFLQNPWTIYTIVLENGDEAEVPGHDIDTSIRSARSVVAGASTVAKDDSKGKKRKAPAYGSDDDIESDSDRVYGLDITCAPVNEKAMVRTWLASVEPPTMPTDGGAMPMENIA